MLQADRVNNVIKGTKLEQVQQICQDISDFKKKSGVEHVIVLWTANTERFCDVATGLNDTIDNLQKAIESNHPEVSPSTLYAYATISMKVQVAASEVNYAIFIDFSVPTLTGHHKTLLCQEL